MESVSKEKDKQLKEKLKNNYSVRYGSWGAARADFPEILTFYWPYDREEYRDRARRTSDFVEDFEFEELYAIAFEREQYAEYEKNFEEKYDNRSVKLNPSEIPEVAEDLIEFMIIPKSMNWMIIFDHEGDISFNGNKKFIEEVKNFFEDWEELSEFPERRDFGRRD